MHLIFLLIMNILLESVSFLKARQVQDVRDFANIGILADTRVLVAIIQLVQGR
jgi:hypothetical protein